MDFITNVSGSLREERLVWLKMSRDYYNREKFSPKLSTWIVCDDPKLFVIDNLEGFYHNEVQLWLEENFNAYEKYYIGDETGIHKVMVRFRFMKDAVAFKMKWG